MAAPSGPTTVLSDSHHWLPVVSPRAQGSPGRGVQAPAAAVMAVVALLLLSAISGGGGNVPQGRHVNFQVFITSPSEGEGVSGVVNVSGAALAAFPYNVTSVFLSIQDGPALDCELSDEGGGYYLWWYSWDTTRDESSSSHSTHRSSYACRVG